MKGDVRITIHHDDVFANYGSGMWDVLAIEGDEEDARIVTIASFATYDAAWSFTSDDAYIIAIRPPSALRDGVAKWMVFMTNVLSHGDMPIQRYRKY